MDIRKQFSGCGENDKKGVNKLKEGEHLNGGMGTRGGWIEVEAILVIREKLMIDFPLGAC